MFWWMRLGLSKLPSASPRLAAFSATNNLSDNALACDLKTALAMPFVVSSLRLLDRIFRRCAFAKEGQRCLGAPPKSFAADAALVLRKLCGILSTHTLRAEPKGWVACTTFSARTDTL